MSDRGESAEEAPLPEGSMKDRLSREMRAAMKSRDAVRLGTLRMLAAAVKNEEVRPGVLHALGDEEFRQVAAREARRRREAAHAYEQAGRPDRAARELEELAVLQEYLPAPLSDREIEALIEEAVAATAASEPGDLGKVMGVVMGSAGGRADGTRVREMVRHRLGG